MTLVSSPICGLPSGPPSHKRVRITQATLSYI